MLVVEIEGGLEIGEGVALGIGSEGDRESFDLLRIRTTYEVSAIVELCQNVPDESGGIREGQAAKSML